MNDDKKMYDVIIDVKQGDPNARPDPRATSSLEMKIEAPDEGQAERIARASLFDPIFDVDTD